MDRKTERHRESEKCANCSPVKIANEKTERQTDRKTKLQQNEKFESAAVGSLHLWKADTLDSKVERQKDGKTETHSFQK